MESSNGLGFGMPSPSYFAAQIFSDPTVITDDITAQNDVQLCGSSGYACEWKGWLR